MCKKHTAIVQLHSKCASVVQTMFTLFVLARDIPVIVDTSRNLALLFCHVQQIAVLLHVVSNDCKDSSTCPTRHQQHFRKSDNGGPRVVANVWARHWTSENHDNLFLEH